LSDFQKLLAESTPVVDTRVAALLQAEQTKFSIDGDGDYLIRCRGESNRVQTVWVNSGTAVFENVEIREIWSVAYESAEPLPAEIAQTLLERNSVLKLGAWSVDSASTNRVFVVFKVRTDANNQKASSLDSMIDFVAMTASGMSDELDRYFDSGKKIKVWSPYQDLKK
jgi:hypothetical protein